jgi:hypothetical protein
VKPAKPREEVPQPDWRQGSLRKQVHELKRLLAGWRRPFLSGLRITAPFL